jgi:FkbH-like protein
MSDIKVLKEVFEAAYLPKIIRMVKESNYSFASKISVYVLRNHTIDNFEWFIRAAFLLGQITPHYSQGDFDVTMPQMMDKKSQAHLFQADIVVLSLVLETLVPDFSNNTFIVNETLERVESIIKSLIDQCPATIVCNTFFSPLYDSNGTSSLKMQDSLGNRVKKLNDGIVQLGQKYEKVHIVDWNIIEQRLGTGQSRNYKLWYMAKMLLTDKFLKEYATEVACLAKSIRGLTKKCIILDCDNTLWGGIIGEDGINHIQLNPHDYPGNIFYKFQQVLLQLAERGVLLALCSKNNDVDVLEVMEKHPYCIVKKEHLVTWRVNWEDKASNIQNIAEELNLGVDSFVFVDDNPVECDLIRKMQPDVTVIQVPKDLAYYPNIIEENRCFYSLNISKEDRKRTQMYKTEKLRKSIQENSSSMEEFFASLKLIASIHEARQSEIPRISQLTQKTNQFNLTTKRYSEGEIEGFLRSDEHILFVLYLRDKYGEYGLTGVMIAERKGDIGYVDSFLMSCRILGRKTELAFANCCFDLLEEAWDVKYLEAEYLQTIKNHQTENFWNNIGFTVKTKSKEGAKYKMYSKERKKQNLEFIEIEL